MYHLARSLADNPAGPRKILVTERTMESKRGDDPRMSLSAPIDLEVEPNLAAQLDKLESSQWSDKVAILSLWFPGGGDAVLVKAEILLNFTTRLRKGFQPKGDLEYQTLVVTPEKSEQGKGIDADWEEAGRMLHFANSYRDKVKALNRMQQDVQFSHLQETMGAMWSNMMKGAAAEAAAERTRQSAIMGR
jgi:hypothetical protein